MRFAFTEDQRAFGRAVAEVLEKHCAPEVVRAAEASREPRDPALWRALAELGVVGMLAPEEHGGLGMNEIDTVLVLEASGRAALPEPLVEPVAVAVPLLDGNEWLPRVVAGDARVSVGLFEHALDADIADVLLMREGTEVYLVERTNVQTRAVQSIDGARRLFDVSWSTDGATMIAGSEGLTAAFVRGVLATSAQLLGVADHLIATAAAYATQRTQFGVAIGSFQAVKHHLADALLKLEFARPVVYNAAYSVAHTLPSRSRDASMAKAFASEAAINAARTALQVHGAIGYTQESDLHLWMKRAWALAGAWGDAPFHRERVAHAVLGPVAR
jgi:alkylation response protein AidB-like acyl-CoA dehydrogenase